MEPNKHIHDASYLHAVSADEEDACERIRLVMKLRAHGICNTEVLSAIENTPRALFRNNASASPTTIAWMVCALEVTKRVRVLEIGTGDGYQTAILNKLSRRVYTVDQRVTLELAEQRFQTLHLANIVTKRSEGVSGWKEAAPFERIIVNATVTEVPASLLEQLALGGIMVIPVGKNAAEQILLRIRKDENGQLSTQHMMHVRFAEHAD